MHLCGCVCVCERNRGRGRERKNECMLCIKIERHWEPNILEHCDSNTYNYSSHLNVHDIFQEREKTQLYNHWHRVIKLYVIIYKDAVQSAWIRYSGNWVRKRLCPIFSVILLGTFQMVYTYNVRIYLVSYRGVFRM